MPDTSVRSTVFFGAIKIWLANLTLWLKPKLLSLVSVYGNCPNTAKIGELRKGLLFGTSTYFSSTNPTGLYKDYVFELYLDHLSLNAALQHRQIAQVGEVGIILWYPIAVVPLPDSSVFRKRTVMIFLCYPKTRMTTSVSRMKHLLKMISIIFLLFLEHRAIGVNVF